MSLQQQLFDDYLQAMKVKDEYKKSILNYVIAQVKNKKIETQKDLEDTEVVKILKKEIKVLGETISFLKQAPRLDELAIEQSKKSILEAYLPQAKSREETKDIVLSLIQELGITQLATQRGQIMSAIKTKYGDEVEGFLANEVINELLK